MQKMTSLRIFNKIEAASLPEKKIVAVTQHIYFKEKIDPARKVNCICCGDYKIRQLNCDYRNKDKVTDVLSFPFSDPDFLGEIYISYRRVEVQSRKFGVSPDEEFLRLFIHGLLHLAGYDHLKPSDRVVMEKRESLYHTAISLQ